MTKIPNTPKQTARASNIFTVIGVVANVAGIVSLLYTQLELVGIVIAGIAVASGAYLIVRRWGRPLDHIAIFAILIMLAGTAVLAVVTDRRGGIIPAPPEPRPTVGPTGTPIPASHRLLYDNKVKFMAITGLDVDKRGVAPLTGAAAEVSPADLYIDINDYLRSPAGDMFSYNGYDAEAPTKCAQIIAAGKDPKSIDLSGYAYGTYCFLTSLDNVGTIHITKSAIIGNSPQDYIEATIMVWAK